MSEPVNVLVVGQTPPPYGGQAVAIESFVGGRYDRLRLTHVRMGFSDAMEDVGKFRPGKVTHLIGLVLRILWQRWRTGATVLYYPPAGPDIVPVLRDIVVLLCTRWAFDHTVFHFHASGLCEIYPRLPRPLRAPFRRAYHRPDLAIQPSALNPEDGSFVSAKRTVVVPGGVADGTAAVRGEPRPTGRPVLLFVGVLRESKGVLVLLEAARLLRERGCSFELRLMGEFESPAFEQQFRRAVVAADLEDAVVLLGTLTGQDKLRSYRDANVFCYPTHFGSESFGLVLLEAMQFELPVVATDWRGVPGNVRHGETGYLVPIKQPDAIADCVQRLLQDPDLARRMGRAGRALYLEQFTEERYRRRMEEALLQMSDVRADR